MSTEALIRAEVAARLRVILDAMRFAADADYRDKSVPEIRATAVATAKGPEAIDGRCDDAIEAVFDCLLDDATGDPVRRAMARRHVN